MKRFVTSCHCLTYNRTVVLCNYEQIIELLKRYKQSGYNAATSISTNGKEIKKELKIKRSLYEILQILSISLFEQMPIEESLMNTYLQSQKEAICN